MDLFLERNKITKGSNAVGASETELKTAVVDMAGFEEVTYLVKFATVSSGSVITFTPKENTANSTSSPAPTAVPLTKVSGTFAAGTVLTGGALVLTEQGDGALTGTTVAITIRRLAMSKEFQFLDITIATANCAFDSITIIQSTANSLPVTQSADVCSTGQAAA